MSTEEPHDPFTEHAHELRSRSKWDAAAVHEYDQIVAEAIDVVRQSRAVFLVGVNDEGKMRGLTIARDTNVADMLELMQQVIDLATKNQETVAARILKQLFGGMTLNEICDLDLGDDEE